MATDDASTAAEHVDHAAVRLARGAGPDVPPTGETGPGSEPARRGRIASRTRVVNGLRMHSREASGEDAPTVAIPIVLVHGLVVSSLYMVPLAELFAAERPVFAVDLPGFGRSEHPPRALDVPELADALAAWVDAAGIERAAFLGNSLGCQILADFTVRHPHRVHKLVLVGPSVDPDAHSFPRQAWRLLRDIPREKPSLPLLHLRDYWAAGARRAARTVRFMLRDRIEARLPRIPVPTLVVRGGQDPVVPQAWAEEARRLLPLGQLHVIPGAAHAVNYDAPLELARVVEAFLES